MPHRLFAMCVSLCVAFAGVMLAANAMASERFAQQLQIQPGLVVVVAEGDFEARSIGSYAVRVYADPSAIAGNETTFYAAGLVRPRDGFVRSVELLTVAGRTRPLLMVVIESAGSGSYLSAEAFAIGPRSVRLLASIDSLAPNEDPALTLRRKLGSRN